MLFSGDVKLNKSLLDPINKIGQKSRASLEGALGRVQGRNRAGQEASGRTQGEYTGQELGRASTMANRGVEDTLAGALGGASYDELMAEQEHQRNLALANEIGKSSKPGLLEEVLGGIGATAPLLLTGSSLYKNRRKPTQNLPPKLSLFDSESMGLGRYS